MEQIQRSSGVLAPIFALPGARDVGALGKPARNFVDFLASAGQKWLQTTPINPIDSYNSPYAGRSAFAGETLYLDLEDLREQGLLDDDDLDRAWRLPTGAPGSALVQKDPRSERIDYRAAFERRAPLWKKAFARYVAGAGKKFRDQEESFREENRDWLDDYALFEAIAQMRGGVYEWSQWPPELRRREPNALRNFAERERERLEYLKFLQLVFDVQWREFRDYAKKKGVKLFGDLPIYVGLTSADVWSNPELFQVDPDGNVIREAGVPSDDFNPDGQRWSSPVYRWSKHRETNFKWQKRRVGKTLERFDLVRLDHFIGFYNYYSFPGKDYPNAQPEPPERTDDGKVYERGWTPGPQDALFDALFEDAPSDAFVAEDLGVMNDGVRDLRDKYRLPGMRVLQFSFGDLEFDRKTRRVRNPLDEWSDNDVAYTGTHDCAPILGWLDDEKSANPREFRAVRDVLKRYERPGDEPAKTKRGLAGAIRRAWNATRGADAKLGVAIDYRPLAPDVAKLRWATLRAVAESPCRIAIFPLQDVAGLSNDARINFPGVASGNWSWRIADGVLTESLARELRNMTRAAGRD